MSDADRPYIGLRAYTEAEAQIFFGREREAIELARLVENDTMSILYGVSGIGKSSLLNAGVFPRLRTRDFLPVRVRLDHDEKAPPLPRQLLNALHAAAKEAHIDLPEPRDGETLWEFFHHRERIEFWTDDHQLLTPLIALDQFEELFSLGAEKTERLARSTEFRAQLHSLMENTPPASLIAPPETYVSTAAPPRVLLILREDFIAQLLPIVDALAERLPSVHRQKLRLGRLDTGAAHDVIAGPARALGLEPPDEDAIRTVLRFATPPGDETSASPGGVEPARLALMLSLLEDERRTLHLPRINADLASHAGTDLFARFVDSILDEHPAARVFVEEELVTPSGYRSDATEDQAGKFGVGKQTLRALQERRLLTARPGWPVRYELTHDLLCPPLKFSREKRLEESAKAEKVRQRTQLRHAWMLNAVLILCVAAAAVAFGWAMWETHKARQAVQDAKTAEQKARDAATAAKNSQDAEVKANEGRREALIAVESSLKDKDEALKREETERSRADKNSELANQAIEVFTQGLVEEVKILPGARADFIQRLITTVLRVYESLPATEASATRIGLVQAGLRSALSQTLLRRGDSDGAVNEAKKAIAALLKLPPTELAAPKTSDAVCRAYFVLSEAYRTKGVDLAGNSNPAGSGNFDESLKALEAAKKLVDAKIAAAPGDSVWVHTSADCEDQFGDLLLERAKAARAFTEKEIGAKKQFAVKAREHYEAAFKSRSEMSDKLPPGLPRADSDNLRRLLATSHNKLGNVYLILMSQAGAKPTSPEVRAVGAQALGEYKQAFDLRSSLRKEHQDDLGTLRDLALTLGNIGTVHAKMGDFSRAFDYLEQRLKFDRELYEKDPSNVLYQSDLGLVLMKIADFHQQKEAGSLFNMDKAETVLEEAVQVTEGQIDEILKDLIKVYRSHGHGDKAVPYERTLKALKKEMARSGAKPDSAH